MSTSAHQVPLKTSTFPTLPKATKSSSSSKRQKRSTGQSEDVVGGNGDGSRSGSGRQPSPFMLADGCENPREVASPAATGPSNGNLAVGCGSPGLLSNDYLQKLAAMGDIYYKPRPGTKDSALSLLLKDHTSAVTSDATAPTGSDTTSSTGPTFTVVAGSYEKLLYGLKGTFASASSSKQKHGNSPSSSILSQFGEVSFEPLFIFPAHIGCVKAVAVSPEHWRWLVTGSMDETIKVWDLKRKKEVGGLMQHTGSITQLAFPTRSHVMSSSEDGTIVLFRTREWSVLRVFKGHTGRVNSFAVHPSGKVALSVGKDKMLRMWDMMRGKGKGATKLSKEAECVRWDTNGTNFAIAAGNGVDIYTTAMTVVTTINHPSRIHEIRFIKHPSHSSTRDLIFIAAEDKKISVYEPQEHPATEEGISEAGFRSTWNYVLKAELIGHNNRVKAFDTLVVSMPSTDSKDDTPSSTRILASCSSDGNIHIYDLALLPAPCFSPSNLSTPGTNIKEPNSSNSPILKLRPIGVYDTKGTRLTCLTLAEGEAKEVAELPISVGKKRGKKRKLREIEDEDEDEDESGDEGEREGGSEESEGKSEEVQGGLDGDDEEDDDDDAQRENEGQWQQQLDNVPKKFDKVKTRLKAKARVNAKAGLKEKARVTAKRIEKK
ncbi:WD40-repeat-containing domain protein [Cantharellus anzutake]|uniref:WD40-repeat-containing domain protein n=1 Tax=Cantharellus anzutake TaxID=1750568 RepID=UPI001905EF72|nr:WD40-repeat-containing domain protein [Cantharellus anzutake]KAF8324348.1 WD40-repeat-containing domain protein [Cantharellus anzutake]